ncbi:calcineurin responsive zinc-finger, partial [Scheffersomyces stipitis CBS 6054]
PILPSTQAPHGRNGYPISPVSIHDITRDATSSASSTSSSSGSSNLPIDYSSIVSYTISPSLKRKRRRRKQSLEVDPATGAAGSETYPCEVCDKVFLKPYNLKSHMKTHSSDKPFKCSHCFKTFARSHDKKRHELLHNGVKNFKCEGYLQDGVTKWGCGKKFARSDALSRHFRTETGWLCIRPLMDEAKRLEENPNNPRAVLSQGEMTPGEFLDSSSFIRRLIQSK